ncbi:GDSL esterase/lipase [Ananas comosus]|uniref:GDSL esterase/lipase n=1 Tax=Ananas comosus TaxID=4615 RepID=A0A199UH29_ANACO|nr:GDSL esterase/lipase [Ananas comosus]
MFVFGDSLIDNGNNNDLPSFAKANYYPYGIDFSGGPTGRFSNGYTIVGRIPFNQQIRNFAASLAQISTRIGRAATSESVRRSVLFVGFGSNDYLNNYLMPNYNTRLRYNKDQFSDLLIRQYRTQLISLYNFGARKFMIANVGVLGCIPSVLAQNFLTHCSEEVDNLVLPFNNKVKLMVNNLNANLANANFIYIDIYDMFADILNHPTAYGFSVIDRGCCGIGRNSGQISCLPFQTPCDNREQYIFWDAFHPTSKVNIILARRAFNGSSNSVFPMNILQLASYQPRIGLEKNLRTQKS